jgi:D-alanyl-D-alanine carboxypeptidase (penicillin-binding protein 5/6)
MHRTIVLFIATLFFSLPALARPIPAPPSLGATSYVLADADSNRIITEKEIDTPVEPASITKIMSGYIVFQSLEEGLINLQDKVLISEKAWKMEGSRMFIEAGSLVSVEDLIKGMIIQSGNDATVALAEHIAGTEDAFTQMMNQQAELLGMKHTHYMNATGLPDPNHYSTARDILTLTRALIRNFPKQYEWYSQKEFTFNDIKQSNRNKLLWQDKRVDGVKTGHTESAGFCLVSSAKQDKMRLISVVLGTRSKNDRIRQSQALLNYGFRYFETRKLYTRNQKLADARLWKGAESALPLGIQQDIYVTYPKGEGDKLDARIDRPRLLEAPVKAGEPVGKLTVSLKSEVLAEAPLVALKNIDEGHLLTRLTDTILLMFE